MLDTIPAENSFKSTESLLNSYNYVSRYSDPVELLDKYLRDKNSIEYINESFIDRFRAYLSITYKTHEYMQLSNDETLVIFSHSDVCFKMYVRIKKNFYGNKKGVKISRLDIDTTSQTALDLFVVVIQECIDNRDVDFIEVEGLDIPMIRDFLENNNFGIHPAHSFILYKTETEINHKYEIV